MIINIQDDILKLHSDHLLQPLLADKSTKRNIIWATSSFDQYGAKYGRNEEIKPALITGVNSNVIKTRARRILEQQALLTKKHAEVFTPLWVCQKMNDYADAEWFGRSDAFSSERVDFQDKSWKDYVTNRRLELTMGEAPFITSRYNVETGEYIPIANRIGLLDRKLRVVSENTDSEEEWFEWVRKAYQSIYGYEYQGDSLLIARVNLLQTFIEVLEDKWNRDPKDEELKETISIIVWNCWQMDGLTGQIPFSKNNGSQQMDWFSLMGDEPKKTDVHIDAMIYDWEQMKSENYTKLKERREDMKFDYIIGNPPYQEEAGGTSSSDKPIYNFFMDESYNLAKRTLLVTPARFLFNAGATKKSWNEKMLSDKHFRVLDYIQKSERIFPNTDIKGGVAITIYDNNKDFGEIGVFTAFNQLNEIFHKVKNEKSIDGINQIIYTQNKFNLKELNNTIEGLNRTDKRLESNIFQLEVFTENENSSEQMPVLGLINNRRVTRFIDKKYIECNHPNLNFFKVIVPKSNGSGAIGEVLSTPLIGEPLIGEPLIGYTRSFIGIGAFDTEMEAQACLKYVKSKFARTMLGILKVTQDNNPDKWKYVPLQDFTPSSDIDWSQSVADIDKQLYKKYGLSDEEIEFIESHVKEMV